MEEDFDLRPFVKRILQKWKLIFAVAILTAATAFIASSFLPVSYQARSLIAFFESNNIFQFDARIVENSTSTPLRALPELAKSDEVIMQVLASLPDTYDYDRESLAQQLSVALGDDASIIRFTANADTAQSAAELANIWGETFVNWANDIYSNQNGDQVRYFEEQLQEANVRLDHANQNLADFTQISQSIILSNTLQVTQQNHVAKLEQYNNLENLSADAEALQQLIQSQNTPVSFADQLSYLQLQLAAFGEANNPILLQASPGGAISTVDQGAQIALLTRFQEVIEQKLIETGTDLSNIETKILELQQHLQASLMQETRLIREVEIANQTVTTLGLKVEEEKVAALDTNDGFQIISRAALPKNPTGPRRIFNAAVAGALGFSLAVVFIIAQMWWQGYEPLPTSTSKR